MADIERMKRALVNAHRAGDEQAARALTRAIRAAQPEPQVSSVQDAPAISAENAQAAIDGRQTRGEAMAAWLNKAGEAMTFGVVGDEAAAAADALIGRGTYDDRLQFYRDQEATLERERPGLALAADIVGSALGTVLPGGAVARGAGFAKGVGTSMGLGALGGATYGFAEGEGSPQNRLQDGASSMAFGAGAGLAAPIAGSAVRSGANRVLRNRAVKRAAEHASSAAEARAAAAASYDAFEEAGAEVSPEALSRLKDGITRRLNEGGMSRIPAGRRLTPGGQIILDAVKEMDDEVQAAVARGENPAIPLAALEDLRRVASDVAETVNPIGRATRDARLGVLAIDEIDGFVESLQKADVPIGDPEVAVAALQKARELWGQGARAQMIENILDRQDDYLGGQASAIRNGIGSLLRNRRTSRQFSSAEKAVLRRIIGGNAASRAIRLLGNGIGRQLQMAGGASAGGIPGALAGMVTGEVSAGVANRNAVSAAEIARDVIASGALRDVPVAPEALQQITERVVRRIGVAVPQ